MAEAGKKPGGLQRPAAGILAQLLKAKGESDRKNYPAKHDLLRRLIKESPEEFRIDSEEGGIYGLTHAPTGFRIHMPRAAAPSPADLEKEGAGDKYLGPDMKNWKKTRDKKAGTADIVKQALARLTEKQAGKPPVRRAPFWSKENFLNMFGDDSRDPMGPGLGTQALTNTVMDRFPGTYKNSPRSGVAPQQFGIGASGKTALIPQPPRRTSNLQQRQSGLQALGARRVKSHSLPHNQPTTTPSSTIAATVPQHRQGYGAGSAMSAGHRPQFPVTPVPQQIRPAASQQQIAQNKPPATSGWRPTQGRRPTANTVSTAAPTAPHRTPPPSPFKAPRIASQPRFMAPQLASSGSPKHFSATPGRPYNLIDRATQLLEKAAQDPRGVRDEFASDVKNVLDSIIEKQAQPTFSRLQMPGGNQTMRNLFQGVGGPIEQGVDLFNSPSDYLDEMMTVPYVGETPLYSDKKSLWDNIKNLLMRPINRRERLRNEREHLVRTQWAVQSLGGHQAGAPSRGFPGLPGRGTLNYGQQSFQQAQSRNLPFIAQLILNEPGGYRMVRDTGKASTWLHMGSGYQFTVPNKPDPKDLLNIHVEPPKQDMWASALRWRQGRATSDDMKKFKLDKASRQAAAQKLLERQKATPPILNEGI